MYGAIKSLLKQLNIISMAYEKTVSKHLKIRDVHINMVCCFNGGRIGSVSRALDCRAEGCRFDSQGQTNTQGLKITEK